MIISELNQIQSLEYNSLSLFFLIVIDEFINAGK